MWNTFKGRRLIQSGKVMGICPEFDWDTRKVEAYMKEEEEVGVVGGKIWRCKLQNEKGQREGGW